VSTTRRDRSRKVQQRRAHRSGAQSGAGALGEEEDVTALIAFLLLLVMFVIGARVRGVRDSWWKLLAFVTACVVVLALLLAILSK
jgi:isoprenylcysteine carboxyl methyltransferase (ICMT) family protein YpbQ